jgi:hypothetical protein
MAFLDRNGLAFRPGLPPPGAPAPGQIIQEVQLQPPIPGAFPAAPSYGLLSCPVRCSGAVLARPDETLGAWFVPFPTTAYGARDMAWVLTDISGDVRVVSTRDNP